MADPVPDDPDQSAEIVILSDWKREREEYKRRKTERHKRRLQREMRDLTSQEEKLIRQALIESSGPSREGLWTEGELPAFPGGLDDMELGDK